MGPHAINPRIFKEASCVTASYLLLYSATMVYQGLSRTRMEFLARKAGKHFDRYTDPRMRPLDRVVGNTLEWMPVFLGLFWLSLALQEDTIRLGWAYVGFRALYCTIVYSGKGISKTTGAKAPIIIATAPAYYCLYRLAAAVLSKSRS